VITKAWHLVDPALSTVEAMTRRHSKWTLLLVLGSTSVVGVACSSGGTGAVATTKAPATAPLTAAGATTGSTAAATCRSTTTATGGSGGGDVLVPGDIPDTAHYVTYRGAAFHVDHPEGWAQQATATSVTLTDKFNSIRVETTSSATAPSVASAQSSDVAALKTSAPCFEAGKVTQVSRSAGTAVLITYRADSPADPVTGKVVREDVERYEFWQSGTMATITLSAPKGSDNVDPWKKVTDSFGWGA
jgi:hypothetical protein